MRYIIAAFLCFCATTVNAASTAENIQPGYLTISGCPGGLTPCFVAYSAAHPLPVTASASAITGVLPVVNGGTGTSTAFTAGSVVFAGASGTYTQDNTNLFWNNASKRLGIGTATPGSALDVSGTVNATTFTGSIAESYVAFTNISTGNASITKHGFLPILSNNALQFLNGQGNWTTPAIGIATSYLDQSFTAQTSVTVTHNFCAYPVVQIFDNTGAMLVPLTITNTSVNAFTVTFTGSTSGDIIATLGTPVLNSYTTVAANYVILSSDVFVECTSSGKTLTLPDATLAANQKKQFNVDNSSVGNITVNTTSSQTIQGSLVQTLPPQSNITVVSNGSNWRIK